MLVQGRGMDGWGQVRTAGDRWGWSGMGKDGQGWVRTAGDGTNDVS